MQNFGKKLHAAFILFSLVVVIWLYFWTERAERYFDKGYEYYEKGDWQSAIEQWKSASEAGKDAFFSSAQEAARNAEFNLGLIYTKGEHGIVENYQEAAKWYGLAAEGGMKEAQVNLAICYLSGQGVPRNPEKGVEWLKKAARQRFQKAQDILAELGIYDYDN